MLGFGRVFDYPRDTGLPLMWSEQTGYFYMGVMIAKLKSSDFVEMPEVVRLDNLFSTERLMPCNIAAMTESNSSYIEALADTAIERVTHYYEEYKDNTDIVW